MKASAVMPIEGTLIRPRKARDYARAAGFLAKTDCVDAAMLADYAAHVPLLRTEPIPQESQDLRALLDRRGQLAEIRKAEEIRLQQHDRCEIAAEIEEHIESLDQKISAYDAAIEQALGKPSNGRSAGSNGGAGLRTHNWIGELAIRMYCERQSCT
jgi:transposase